LTDGLGSGEGVTGAGVAAAGVFGLAFELLSVLGSQAASVNDSSTIAKSFLVMIVLRSYWRLLQQERWFPSSVGEWERKAKRFMPEIIFLRPRVRSERMDIGLAVQFGFRVLPLGCCLPATS
jgi:hypothetical protein